MTLRSSNKIGLLEKGAPHIEALPAGGASETSKDIDQSFGSGVPSAHGRASMIHLLSEIVVVILRTAKELQKIKIMIQETKSFPSAPAFRDWLASHHSQADGIWLRFFKKTSGEKYLAYSDALDEALCYGWIDGQAKAYDEQSWLQRFGPRRPASSW